MNINERAAGLAQVIAEATDQRVLTGPFAGMKLPKISGLASPYYLGTYEHELHPVIEQIASRSYDNILNVGCGFGYYAVGLALKFPKAKVYAYDIDDNCIKALKDMSELNKVHNITANAEWMPSCDLIVMDVEAAEEEMLEHHSGLKADVLVESHECMKPGITQRLIDRFKATHNIDIIHNRFIAFDLQKLFPGEYIEHFDNAIATWEGRGGQTPWLWMSRKLNNDAPLKIGVQEASN